MFSVDLTLQFRFHFYFNYIYISFSIPSYNTKDPSISWLCFFFFKFKYIYIYICIVCLLWLYISFVQCMEFFLLHDIPWTIHITIEFYLIKIKFYIYKQFRLNLYNIYISCFFCLWYPMITSLLVAISLFIHCFSCLLINEQLVPFFSGLI